MRLFLLLCLPVLSLQDDLMVQVLVKVCPGGNCQNGHGGIDGNGDTGGNGATDGNGATGGNGATDGNGGTDGNGATGGNGATDGTSTIDPNFDLAGETRKLEALENELLTQQQKYAGEKANEVSGSMMAEAFKALVELYKNPPSTTAQQPPLNLSQSPACVGISLPTGSDFGTSVSTMMSTFTADLPNIFSNFNLDRLLCYARIAGSLLTQSRNKPGPFDVFLVTLEGTSTLISTLNAGFGAKSVETHLSVVAKKAEVDLQAKFIADHRIVTPIACQSGSTSNDVKFLLWNRANQSSLEGYELIAGDCVKLSSSSFDSTKPTYVIVHSFKQNGKTGWLLEAKNELLDNKDCNVISIDWSAISTTSNNIYAISAHIPRVAQDTASLLDFLHNQAQLDITSLHMIGFGFGAHILGLTANYVVNGPIGRITGLDPIGPEYEGASNSDKLDSTDANFVDIIHTNGCPVLSFCVGIQESIGHVDYFVNSGKHQPGCAGLGAWEELTNDFCSHHRAVDYWIESINGATKFTAKPCANLQTYETGGCTVCGQGCLDMGFPAATNLRGSYFVDTNAAKPYARG